MDRIYELLPSVLILACVAGAAGIYLRLVTRLFGNNLESVEWLKKNKGKVALFISTPMVNVWHPAVEELIFRAPIIIAFGSVSSVAWYSIFVSSALFAFLHWRGQKITVIDLFDAHDSGESRSDNVEEEMSRLQTKQDNGILLRRLISVMSGFSIGILAGYYGVRYQSVWVAFWIHSAWNFFMPVALPMLILLGMFVFYGAVALWNRWNWSRKLL